MQRPPTGVLLILSAAVLWGTTGTAQELGAADAEPLTVGAVRLLIGGLTLTVLAGASGGFRSRGPARRGSALAMILGVALYQVTFFAAVREAGVALGTVVAIGSAPVLTGFLAWATTRVRPSSRWVLATLVAIVGVVLIGSPASVSSDGIWLALAAGASYAVYAVAAERLVAVMPALGAMAIGFGGGAVLLTPALARGDLSWLGSTNGVLAAVWLGLGTTAAAYALFGRGLQTTPVATAATLSLAEPLTAFLLGVVVLAERPGPVGWIGAVVVLGGLALMNRPAPETKPHTGPEFDHIEWMA